VTAQSWSDSTATFAVPSSVPPGNYNIIVQTSGGTKSNSLPFTVLTGKEIPVTFTVNNVPLATGASVYLTGNILELGNNVQSTNTAVGPLLAVPSASSSWFIDASVPAGAQIQFTFFQVLPDNTIVPEGISHPYNVPNSGVGTTSVSW
jgi:Starch binding domain